jgi:hypothetical protein
MILSSLFAGAQAPVKFGFRFSLKAAIPSL